MIKYFFITIIAILILTSCNEMGETNTLTNKQVDSLLSKDNTLTPLLGEKEENTITMEKEEGTAVRYLKVMMPEVENGPNLGKVIIEVEFRQDTIYSYQVNAGSERTKRPVPVERSGLIEKGDTRTKIAERYGVRVEDVLNREPLQRGQKIILKQ